MCGLSADDISGPPLALVAAGRHLPPGPSRCPRPLPHRARVPGVQVSHKHGFTRNTMQDIDRGVTVLDE